MKKLSLLKKYAVSFTDVIYPEKDVDKILKDLKDFREILSGAIELRKLLINPVLPFSIKERIIDRLANKLKFEDEVSNFLKILTRDYAIKYFEDIYSLILDEIDEKKGIKQVVVKIAPPHTKKQTEKIKEFLRRETGKKIILDVEEVEDLIAGFWVRVGSKVYDGSLKGQLNNLKKKLISGR